jgi:hypothetical protein
MARRASLRDRRRSGVPFRATQYEFGGISAMRSHFRLEFGAIAALLVAGAAQAPAAPCTLAGLSWMAGDWHNSADPNASEEHWTVAPGGVLMGSAFEFGKDGKGYAEASTVRQDGAAINMVLRHFDIDLGRAWEERTAPMIFAAASCDGKSAVFDGQGEHAGEHLTYKRTANGLTIIGDFLHHGKPAHVEWMMIATRN